MTDIRFSRELFDKAPIVGIVRNVSFDVFKELLKASHRAGLSTLEVTMNTLSAEEMIAFGREQMAGQMNIGAGTVCDEVDLKKALAAGAQFIVSPIIDEAVIRECVFQGIPVFPGAYTPTEIYKAWNLGAEAVKVFPATALGPSYIKDLLGPLNNIRLLPTGGVRLNNMKDFAKAGAIGFGLGGSLFPSTLLKDGKWAELTEHIKTYIQESKIINHP